ncbi:MAG TPA: NFACT RNA binding domain-containing protein [Thermoanaerobaculia bacterium]|nr:NFACT RNA binding domain-containing protein [Thermoanaerobaculia bacterium]
MSRDAPRRSKGQPPADPEAGTWQGRPVARRFVSPDGMTVLVGRTAGDNDILTLKLAAPHDFWLHVAAGPGSHVVVRNPARLPRLPRPTERFAASLAAAHSKARAGGQVAVHLAAAADVSKPRGLPPGEVLLRRFQTLRVAPWKKPSESEGDETA